MMRPDSRPAASTVRAFILNPLRQRDNRSVSDFDIRHIVNFNSIWELPFGTGRQFLSGSNGLVNAILGGWQVDQHFPLELWFAAW